jgi:hypothetical protein
MNRGERGGEIRVDVARLLRPGTFTYRIRDSGYELTKRQEVIRKEGGEYLLVDDFGLLPICTPYYVRADGLWVGPTRLLLPDGSTEPFNPYQEEVDEVDGALPAVPAVARAGERTLYTALTRLGRKVKVGLTVDRREWQGKTCIAVKLDGAGGAGEVWWQEGVGVVRTTTHNPVTGTSGYSEFVDWQPSGVEA